MASVDSFDVVKIMVLGDAAVGKTSLIRRFKEEKFDGHSVPTVTPVFYSKRIQIQDQDVQIQIWESPRALGELSAAFLGKVHAVVVMFNVMESESYESIDKWIKAIKDCGQDRAPVMLVGHKVDFPSQRVVSEEMIIKKAKEHGLRYLEASARDGTNADKVFHTLVEECLATGRFEASVSNSKASSSSSSTTRCIVQ